MPAGLGHGPPAFTIHTAEEGDIAGITGIFVAIVDNG
jgi:hypothetical protein